MCKVFMIKKYMIKNKRKNGMDKMSIICEICGVNETDNFDSICDDCKAAMLQKDGIDLGL